MSRVWKEPAGQGLKQKKGTLPKDDEAVGEPSGLVLSCAVVEVLLLLLLAVDSAVLDVEA